MSAQFLYQLTKRVQTAILTRWWNLSGRWLLNLEGVSFEQAPTLYGCPIVSLSPNSKISLGKDVVLCSNSHFTALGVSRPVILRTLRPNASITIGNDTGMSGVAICAAVSIQIGANCLFGADVQIFDTDFHKITADNRRHDDNPDHIAAAPIIIEDNVFIGAGSKIMKGVRIGQNSVIGAGSIVSKDIPPNSIAAGVPAKVIANMAI
ncbi:acyltransferase [Methylomonas sp. AM2-LC]|uniref:acyltransferase n=1 Tax=Methylomonas sp. AM2-LC TaxID=3153301 RepID=UPI0032676E0E